MSPENFMEKYKAALASQNWDNVSPLMHDDACMTFSNGTFKSKDAVKRIFKQNFSSIEDETYVVSNIYWLHRGKESAVCLFDFKWSDFSAGEVISGAGRGTSVLLNTAEGWKLLTEHLGPEAC